MALRKRARRRANPDDAILPLINIVFLLLIFFMVAGRLTTADPLEVSPPRSALGETQGEDEPLLLVGADGALALSGEAIEEEAALARLAEARGVDGALVVRLKADERAEAAEIARLLGRLKAIGVAKVRLLTRARNGDEVPDA